MITREMTIEDVLRTYPETIEVFKEFGLDCFECQIASFEEIASGAQVHQIDIETLLKALNEAIRQ